MLWIQMNREDCLAVDIAGRVLYIEGVPVGALLGEVDETGDVPEEFTLYASNGTHKIDIYADLDEARVECVYHEIMFRLRERMPRLYSKDSGYGGAVLEYHQDCVIDMEEVLFEVDRVIRRAKERGMCPTEYYDKGHRR